MQLDDFKQQWQQESDAFKKQLDQTMFVLKSKIKNNMTNQKNNLFKAEIAMLITYIPLLFVLFIFMDFKVNIAYTLSWLFGVIVSLISIWNIFNKLNIIKKIDFAHHSVLHNQQHIKRYRSLIRKEIILGVSFSPIMLLAATIILHHLFDLPGTITEYLHALYPVYIIALLIAILVSMAIYITFHLRPIQKINQDLDDLSST